MTRSREDTKAAILAMLERHYHPHTAVHVYDIAKEIGRSEEHTQKLCRELRREGRIRYDAGPPHACCQFRRNGGPEAGDGEAWKTIPGLNGLYEASSRGRIRSAPGTRFSKVLKPKRAPHGYPIVTLGYLNGKRPTRFVHRLVAETFLGPCPPGMQCAHLDGNPLNSAPENLAWTSPAENHSHKERHGTAQKGSRSPTAILDEGRVAQIRARCAAGESQSAVAASMGVSSTTVNGIVKRKSWKHVP
jgi:hypothetical protein